MRSSDQEVAPAHDQAAPELGYVIARERAAMDSDLVRARELLRDGMAKLHGFFDALNATFSAQSELLSKLGNARTPDAERASTLAQLRADHEQVLSLSQTAILGLQLEDVLGQLLDYTRKRADGVSSLANLLKQVMDAAALAGDSALREQLRRLLEEAEQRSHDLAVRQESLGGGDVELF
jgi:hypothetical protein